jgi:alanine racemase
MPGAVHPDSSRGYTAVDICLGLEGRLIGRRGADTAISQILFDSRKLAVPEGALFFALKGPRRDGHEHIPELYARGVRHFVVDRPPLMEDFPEGSFILVDDTLKALQTLGGMHRSRFHIPLVGITGSNGKTIVKEWLFHLLSPFRRVVRSPKSYNSRIGVPLSLWQMGPQDEVAIIEAGISMPGEMDDLERIIRPTLGIFTNLGDAHDEGFTDRRQKAREKMRLFRRCHRLVYCRDHSVVHEAAQERFENPADAAEASDLAWGRHESSDLRLLDVAQSGSYSVIRFRYNGREMAAQVPFADAASVENAMHALAVCLLLGSDAEAVVERMGGLPPVAMRLELREALNRCVLINDSYSADLHSLDLALDFLEQQKRHERRTVILSDIPQSGLDAMTLYGRVARALKARGVDRLIGIGPELTAHASIFMESVPETVFHAATDLFVERFQPSMFREEGILLKGARAFAFERIAQLLEQKLHRTVLEIDLDAVSHNLRQYQSLIRPETATMAMVKAFSYGAGAFEMARLLQFHGVDWLAVAYTDEGVDLRKAGIRLPIMVMNAEEHAYRQLTDFDLQPEVFSIGMARSFSSHLLSEGIRDFPVHIKLDTGMHRLGFAPEEAETLGRFIREQGTMRVQTVFSHLVASEDPSEDAFTWRQAELFLASCETLSEVLGYRFLRHLANTAAVRRHPHLQFDMVRLGIGLYGVDPTGSHGLALKEASTLRTTVAQVRPVRAGEAVGYNRKWRLERDSLIATIRIGYADGYPRSLGNGVGRVLVRGRECPVVGHVCMDMTMVDVTGLEQVGPGDDVILFGPSLPVSRVARMAGTIPYEILTGVSQRVQRVYFQS